jgi:hypothetical protein
MITKIVERLKTGTYKNVVQFGVEKLPSAPYVVVKYEREALGALYRVIAHFKPGQNTFLEDYVTDELMTLLDEYESTTRHGNFQKVYATDEMSGIITDNDDGTIAMERVFLAPGILF